MSVEKEAQHHELTPAEVDARDDKHKELEGEGINVLATPKPLAITGLEVDHPPFQQTLAAWTHIVSIYGKIMRNAAIDRTEKLVKLLSTIPHATENGAYSFAEVGSLEALVGNLEALMKEKDTLTEASETAKEAAEAATEAAEAATEAAEAATDFIQLKEIFRKRNEIDRKRNEIDRKRNEIIVNANQRG
jgi:hypothetical protein